MVKDKVLPVPRSYYINLYEIAKAVNSSLRVSDVMTTIVERVAVAMEAKACALLLLSPDKQHMWIGHTCGLSESYLQRKPLLADAGIIGKCCAEHRPILVSKASEDPQIKYRLETKEEDIASILFVPLTVKEEVLGVMSVYTSDPRVFPDEEAGFVQAVADIGAQALANARCYEWARRMDIEIAPNLLEWYSSWAEN